jgi:hypothetical protein
VSSYIKEINDARTSRSNINVTFSTLQRRLALDPWLPLVTTVTPSTVRHPAFSMMHTAWQANGVSGFIGVYACQLVLANTGQELTS